MAFQESSDFLQKVGELQLDKACCLVYVGADAKQITLYSDRQCQHQQCPH